MKRARVLFEASPMVDNAKTGVGYYVDRLIGSLAVTDRGLDLSGYFFDFLGHNHKVAPELPGVRFRKIQLVPGKLLSVCRRLGFQPPLNLFIRQRSDVVLYTNYVSLPTAGSVKNALIIYDMGFLDCPEFLQQVNLSYLQRFCPPSIKNAELIITISEFTKARIIHYFPEVKADIVVTPIPPPLKPPQSAKLPQILQAEGITSGNYLLHVGTIEPRKNIAALVQAYSSLPAHLRQSYALVLAGGKGWQDEDILRKITEAQARGMKVITTGYISESVKEALYAHARAFVSASHYEGFGMPLFEAMQHGLPVAASDIPVYREVAGDAALYFDKDAVQDMSTALKKILTDDAVRSSLTEAGNKRLHAYSWGENATLVSAALKELCD